MTGVSPGKCKSSDVCHANKSRSFVVLVMSHSGGERLDLLSPVEPAPSLMEGLEMGQVPCYLFPFHFVWTMGGWRRMGKIGRVSGWKLLTW